MAHLDGHPAGFMENNRTGQSLKWKAKGYALSEEEKANYRPIAPASYKNGKWLKLPAKRGGRVSARIIGRAPQAPGDHQYLQSKQARPGDLRVVPEDGGAFRIRLS